MENKPKSSIVFTRNPKIDYDNTGEETVAISISKARIIYRDFIKSPRKETILSLLGLATTCLAATLTGSSSDIFGIEGTGNFIHLLFCLGAGVFAVWLIIATILYVLKRKDFSEERFIARLKNVDK